MTNTTTTTPDAPSQVRHPWRATLRTAAAGTLTALTLLTLVIPVFVDGMGEYVPHEVREALLGAAAFSVVLLATITRIMAIPAVNRALSALGLGAEPYLPKHEEPRP